MPITTSLVQNASDHLSDLTKAMAITYLRNSDKYRSNALVFSPLLTTRINAAEGTVNARMINAIITEIDKLGVGEVSIRGDKDAVWWNQHEERQALIDSLFDILIDQFVDAGTGTSEGVIPGLGLYGYGAFGNRPCIQTSDCNCGCNTCPGVTRKTLPQHRFWCR